MVDARRWKERESTTNDCVQNNPWLKIRIWMKNSRKSLFLNIKIAENEAKLIGNDTKKKKKNCKHTYTQQQHSSESVFVNSPSIQTKKQKKNRYILRY